MTNGLKISRILTWVAPLILLAALACGDRDSRAQQARELLSRIAGLDPNAPAERRAQQIERLRALRLQDPELARARDACALAHAGLLAAESEQAAAREKLDRAGDAGLNAAELALIANSVRSASQRLLDAHGALPECEAQTRALLERYR